MPTFISEIGIQGRHSFEENATSVKEAARTYGGQTAILGGVDMDRLARSSEGELRTYVRDILETCAPSGSYALGSGNSLANYMPLVNYLAMLDEWRTYRMAHQ